MNNSLLSKFLSNILLIIHKQTILLFQLSGVCLCLPGRLKSFISVYQCRNAPTSNGLTVMLRAASSQA